MSIWTQLKCFLSIQWKSLGFNVIVFSLSTQKKKVIKEFILGWTILLSTQGQGGETAPMNLEGRNFGPTFASRAGPAFPTLSNHVMEFKASALQSQQDDEQQNERNAAELSVRSSWQGTGCFVYYRSRYLEVIPQCVRGKWTGLTLECILHMPAIFI